jgi:hypothetical protein
MEGIVREQTIGVEDLEEVDVSEVQQQQFEQSASAGLRAALDQNLMDVMAGLRVLPPRLMLCDAADRMPKHERWFRLRAQITTRAGVLSVSRPTLSWGQNEDGAEQMQWKSCSSRPPKQRTVTKVTAEDYPAFALGFLIETDKGPVRVNALDAESKRRWLAQVRAHAASILRSVQHFRAVRLILLPFCAFLTATPIPHAQFKELGEATKLCRLSDAELTPLATTHGCFTAADVSASLLVGLGPAQEGIND